MTPSTPTPSTAAPAPWTPAPRTRPSRRRLAAVAGAIVAVGALATTAVFAATGPSSSGYRTAVATTASVSEELTLAGTIQPVSGAKVSFPVSGTVATVDVEAGDTVTTGQTLATLDPTSLNLAAAKAKADLAQARLDLEKALDGQAVSLSSGSGGSGSNPGGSGGPSTGATPSSSSSSGTATVTPAVWTGGTVQAQRIVATSKAVTTDLSPADLASAQQAVLAAQKQLDADLPTARQALVDANAACTEAAATDTATSTVPTTTTAATETGFGTAACSAAQDEVAAAQEVVAQDEDTLATALTTLNQVLSAIDTDSTTGGGPGGGTGTGGTPTDGTTSATGGFGPSTGGNGSSSSNNTGSTATGGTGPSSSGSNSAPTGSSNNGSTAATATAEDLAAFQAKVDAAATAVAVADQAVAQATIVSPIDGTVTQVTLTPGQSATASSTSEAIDVEGTGGDLVATTVTVADIPKVALGQVATVIPDGSSDAIRGTVVSIGAAPTSGTTDYPVFIALPSGTDHLFNGASATVALDLATSHDVVTVPTSAVHRSGSTYRVSVLADGKVTGKKVKVGVVGSGRTEITSGLAAGQEVVLADLDKAMPTSATSSTNTGNDGNGPNGFTGGPPNFGGGPGGGAARPGG